MTGCIPITSFQNPLKNDLTSHHDRKCFWVSCTLIRLSADQKQVMFLTSYPPEQGVEKNGTPCMVFLSKQCTVWRRCGGIHRVFEMSDPGPNHYSSYHLTTQLVRIQRSRYALNQSLFRLHLDGQDCNKKWCHLAGCKKSENLIIISANWLLPTHPLLGSNTLDVVHQRLI